MNKITVRNINLVIGYFFLLVGLVGAFTVLSVSFGYLSWPTPQAINLFVSGTSPRFFPIVIVAIGAYLVKE